MSGRFKHQDRDETVLACRCTSFLEIWDRESGEVIDEASPGDWIVTVPNSDTLVLDHNTFQAQYRPMDDDAQQELSREINEDLSYPRFSKGKDW